MENTFGKPKTSNTKIAWCVWHHCKESWLHNLMLVFAGSWLQGSDLSFRLGTYWRWRKESRFLEPKVLPGISSAAFSRISFENPNFQYFQLTFFLPMDSHFLLFSGLALLKKLCNNSLIYCVWIFSNSQRLMDTLLGLPRFFI